MCVRNVSCNDGMRWKLPVAVHLITKFHRTSIPVYRSENQLEMRTREKIKKNAHQSLSSIHVFIPEAHILILMQRSKCNETWSLTQNSETTAAASRHRTFRPYPDVREDQIFYQARCDAYLSCLVRLPPKLENLQRTQVTAFGNWTAYIRSAFGGRGKKWRSPFMNVWLKKDKDKLYIIVRTDKGNETRNVNEHLYQWKRLDLPSALQPRTSSPSPGPRAYHTRNFRIPDFSPSNKPPSSATILSPTSTVYVPTASRPCEKHLSH